ncbi:MepB family protein, partial [Vagococcus sp.]
MEEKQNIDYEGMTFTIDNTSYRSRLAKLTPKKKGYFVAFWEKNENNINQAFSFANCPDKVVITIIDKQKKGLFIFPKEVLKAKKILRTSEQKGK